MYQSTIHMYYCTCIIIYSIQTGGRDQCYPVHMEYAAIMLILGLDLTELGFCGIFFFLLKAIILLKQNDVYKRSVFAVSCNLHFALSAKCLDILSKGDIMKSENSELNLFGFFLLLQFSASYNTSESESHCLYPLMPCYSSHQVTHHNLKIGGYLDIKPTSKLSSSSVFFRPCILWTRTKSPLDKLHASIFSRPFLNCSRQVIN